MTTVKVILENGETPEQAEDLLFKALETQRNGETHEEDYNDPAMRHVLDRMQEVFKTENELMLQEISEALAKDFDDGNQ